MKARPVTAREVIAHRGGFAQALTRALQAPICERLIFEATPADKRFIRAHFPALAPRRKRRKK